MTTENELLATAAPSEPVLPPWTAASYEPWIVGSGADKLAESAVSPLVAAARPYKHINVENFDVEMKVMQVGLTTRQGRRFKQTLRGPGRDGLQMPWYSIAEVHRSQRNGAVMPSPFTYQVRPSRPSRDENGRPIKYEFLTDGGTPLDVHPCTPLEWMDDAPVVLIAEGLLKGDAALSAYLHSVGLSYHDLSLKASQDHYTRLHTLMSLIPVSQRVLILSVAGIHNTTQNPVDWREVKLKDRKGIIAFDADFSDNPHVHRAAVDLHRRLTTTHKMASVEFLNPQSVAEDGEEIAKAGIDDFLAQSGTWSDLLATRSDSLPDAPKEN